MNVGNKVRGEVHIPQDAIAYDNEKAMPRGCLLCICGLRLAIHRCIQLVRHHPTYRIAAQPDGGKSVVSRYEGSSRLMNEDGASVTDG